MPFSAEWKANLSLAKLGNKNAFGSRWCKSAEAIEKASLAASGPNHWNWQGGKCSEPYGDGWHERLREQIRNRDGRVCQMCGKPENGKKLDVHHIDCDKDNHRPDNLVSLCKDPCHKSTNFNRWYWPAFFQWLKGQKESAFLLSEETLSGEYLQENSI